jgi:hypothetical protein
MLRTHDGGIILVEARKASTRGSNRVRPWGLGLTKGTDLLKGVAKGVRF